MSPDEVVYSVCERVRECSNEGVCFFKGTSKMPYCLCNPGRSGRYCEISLHVATAPTGTDLPAVVVQMRQDTAVFLLVAFIGFTVFFILAGIIWRCHDRHRSRMY